MKRAFVLGALLPVLAFWPLSSCSAAKQSSAASIPPGSTYVALGDSFASMASLSTMDNSEPIAAFCMRSSDNYAHLVAQDLGLKLADVTCQGATVADVLAAHDIDAGLIPGQIDALGTDTRLVTLTIGGNDAQFGAISGCAPDPSELENPATPDEAEELDCIAQARAANDEALARLPMKLDEVYSAIHSKAPNAVVVTTGYLPVIVGSDTCEYAQLLTRPDLDWFDETTEKINTTVRQAAQRGGAIFVQPPDAEHHTGCASPESRWTSIDGEETDSFAMHPTAAGQRTMAKEIVSTLRQRETD